MTECNCGKVYTEGQYTELYADWQAEKARREIAERRFEEVLNVAREAIEEIRKG
jgi:hypothetical protein